MRILVTGAAGFIGSHLCERLLERGDEVVGLDNFDPFYNHRIKQRNLERSNQHPHFHFYQCDLAEPADLAEFWQHHADKLDAVVHLAAKAGVRPSIEDPLGYERANVQATTHLLSLLAGTAPRPKLLFASSSSVYGNNSKLPFSEDDPVDRPISPYAATKRSGELLCHTFHHLYGMDIWSLRFFTVFGPRQRPDLAIHRFTSLILRDQPIRVFGDGSSSRDYTYIDDILAGLLAAIDRCRGFEIINLGSEMPIRLADMIASIEAACGKKARIEQAPPQPGDVDRTFADTAKAGRLLDYRPATNFAEGLAHFVTWWREVNR
jgi:UDP-glucuronate 4-epimerase